LQGLRRICADVRFLGSYPRHRYSTAAAAEPIPTQPGLSNEDFADSAAWLARIRTGNPA
jgi:prephenate dehydratase